MMVEFIDITEDILMGHRARYWFYGMATIGGSLVFPAIANAHVSGDHPGGLMHGLQHPIGGLDHTIAMIAVGLLAAQLGGRALWLLPLTFLGAMVGGSILGHWQALPGVETGILISDFLLGGLILIGLRFHVKFLPAIVALFALVHGVAHGAEMPATVNGLAYGVGFTIATALLHAIGIALGYTIDKITSLKREYLFQLGGWAVILSSIYISLR
jgi:urease accessory protein